MPWGDRTGPWGHGPRTGRGLGYCSGYFTPGYTKGPGMGMGRGRGRGWGYGRGFRGSWWRAAGYYPIADYPPVPFTPDPAEESKYLEQALDGLRKEIEAIEKRLAELAKERKD
ncbi:MAG: DUF5320 domain-containing protein [Candidatus Hodarchaeota archaeon]